MVSEWQPPARTATYLLLTTCLLHVHTYYILTTYLLKRIRLKGFEAKNVEDADKKVAGTGLLRR